MGKQTLKNYLKLGILILGISVLFTNCENESITDTEVLQTESVESAKYWFENNPEQNDYSLLDFAKNIDWINAKSFEKENNIAVEIPIDLKQNTVLVSNKSNTSANRLVILKQKNEYSSFIINISTSKNSLKFITDLTKINYFNIPHDFTGDILIIKNNSKKANLNSIVKGKQNIKPSTIYAREAAPSCYEIVEIFDDGSVRHTGIIFCTNGGGSGGTDYPYHSGSGGTDVTNTSEDGPSCESFNFQNTTDTWQEAAVKNIKFSIYLIDQQGIKYKYTVVFSQPVLFGMPSNFSLGGDVGSGIAAETSANVLNNTMSEISRQYANSNVSTSVVEAAFKDKLKYNYPLYIPGGRVNFNAANFSVIPTEYKTSFFGTGDCN